MAQRIGLLAFVLVTNVLVVNMGCRSKQEGKGSNEFVQAQILDHLPEDLTSNINAKLGDFLVYRGNTIDTAVVRPGGPMMLNHYWEVVKAPPKGVKLLTQISSDNEQWFNQDQSRLRDVLPLDKWPVGKFISDKQQFVLEHEWMSQEAEVSLGAYWVENQERIGWNGPIMKKDRTLPVYRFTVDLNAGDNGLMYSFRKALSPLQLSLIHI